MAHDVCEHLLDEGGADLPADILENAPDVAILATSRTRINLPGEYLINVGGLPAPDAYTIRRWQALAESEAEVETVIARAAADYAAVRLFAQSAARVRPGFRLRADNIADVARICRQVQGLPLGIELAAAWLEALSLPDIAAEIERNLDILATEQRGVPDRQRSIRAVFDTSWALLSDRERAILPMLSVFRGGFAREAAEFVAAASLRDLLGLVNKSWLQPSETRNTRYERRDRPEDAETGTRRSSLAARFQLHALLRQYAEEKLAEMPELEEQARDRQARYFARFLESHLRRMLGREQARAFNAVAEEFDDIHQTWEWWAQRGEFGRLVDQMLLPLFLYATARFVGTDVAPLLDRAIALLQPAAGQAAADPLPAIRLACLLIARAAIYINYFTREFTPGNVDAAWATAQALGDEAPARLGFWYAPLNLTYGWRTARLPAVNNLRAYIAAPGDADEITVAFARQALARLLIREFAPEGGPATGGRSADGLRTAGQRGRPRRRLQRPVRHQHAARPLRRGPGLPRPRPARGRGHRQLGDDLDHPALPPRGLLAARAAGAHVPHIRRDAGDEPPRGQLPAGVLDAELGQYLCPALPLAGAGALQAARGDAGSRAVRPRL